MMGADEMESQHKLKRLMIPSMPEGLCTNMELNMKGGSQNRAEHEWP